MSGFTLGLIIGILGTGLITGVYIAYLLGKQKVNLNNDRENTLSKNEQKSLKKSRRKNIPTEFPDKSNNVVRTKFTVSGTTKTDDEDE